MLDHTLNFLLSQVNDHLGTRYPSKEPHVVLSGLSTLEGTTPPEIVNRVVMSLINVEREGAAGSAGIPVRTESGAFVRTSPALNLKNFTPASRDTSAPMHRRIDGCIEGQVIAVDRFGNAITNLVGRLGGTLELNGTMLPVRRSYADVDTGAPAALVGSTGLIEIAVREGSGAERFGLHRGSKVVLHPR